MKINRREFFKSAANITALTLGLNVFAPSIFKRKLLAAPPESGKKKLLFIFQRGGCDAINTVIPRGDAAYNRNLRPTLHIQEDEALWLDGSDPQYPIDAGLQNGFAQLHPSLEPLMEVYQAGDLAILHRIGYKNQSRSHFDSQQFYENGTMNPILEEGMLYRQAAETLDLPNNRMAALAISGSQLVALKGATPIPNIPNLKTFKFGGTQAQTLKFLGRLPESGNSGRGILGAYGGPKDSPTKPYRELVYQTGLILSDVMNYIQANGINPDNYAPANGATYPSNSSFYYKAKQCAQLLKETPVQICGFNLGGWDTHTNQGRLTGAHPNLLYQVAHVIQSFYRDLRDQWDDVLVVTMTEFSRTSEENASRGTDHGEGIVMFLAGGSVKGGVYNCHASNWQEGDILSAKGRYLSHRTDFRAVFAEIFQKHFGDDLATLNRVIPDYNALAAANPAEYTQLGFL